MATPKKTGAAFLFQFTANWAMENAAPFYFQIITILMIKNNAFKILRNQWKPKNCERVGRLFTTKIVFYAAL